VPADRRLVDTKKDEDLKAISVQMVRQVMSLVVAIPMSSSVATAQRRAMTTEDEHHRIDVVPRDEGVRYPTNCSVAVCRMRVHRASGGRGRGARQCGMPAGGLSGEAGQQPIRGYIRSFCLPSTSKLEKSTCYYCMTAAPHHAQPKGSIAAVVPLVTISSHRQPPSSPHERRSIQ
jgi:hypothetical protein